MSVTFRPSQEMMAFREGNVDMDKAIEVLIIDESGPGVEIRIFRDGEVKSLPLTEGVEHYRASPLWVELTT